MNRINQLFNSDKKDILSIYFCAGDPTLEGTAHVIRTLEKNGVDMIEIGIPFSDPMADGIVIQNAATQSLRNGMSLKLLFEQLRDIRKDVKIPLILMGYLIPIMQFGFENFCRSTDTGTKLCIFCLHIFCRIIVTICNRSIVSGDWEKNLAFIRFCRKFFKY